jgi:hypothetical protein
MRNFIFMALFCALGPLFSCESVRLSDQLGPLGIPLYLQHNLGLVSVTHDYVPSSTFQRKMKSMATTQFPSFVAEANFKQTIQVKFQDYQAVLAPLGNEGSYLCLMQRSTKYKMLLLEWSPDESNFFLQLHATDGKEIFYSTTGGLSDQGGEFAIKHPNPCRYCDVLPANASLSTCFLEYWYNLTQMDTNELRTSILGVPQGAIFGLQSFACVCLQ